VNANPNNNLTDLYALVGKASTSADVKRETLHRTAALVVELLSAHPAGGAIVIGSPSPKLDPRVTICCRQQGRFGWVNSQRGDRFVRVSRKCRTGRVRRRVRVDVDRPVLKPRCKPMLSLSACKLGRTNGTRTNRTRTSQEPRRRCTSRDLELHSLSLLLDNYGHVSFCKYVVEGLPPVC
jgi:hypothetical protein